MQTVSYYTAVLYGQYCTPECPFFSLLLRPINPEQKTVETLNYDSVILIASTSISPQSKLMHSAKARLFTKFLVVNGIPIFGQKVKRSRSRTQWPVEISNRRQFGSEF